MPSKADFREHGIAAALAGRCLVCPPPERMPRSRWRAVAFAQGYHAVIDAAWVHGLVDEAGGLPHFMRRVLLSRHPKVVRGEQPVFTPAQLARLEDAARTYLAAAVGHPARRGRVISVVV